MIIYIEKKYKNNEISQKIISSFKNPTVLKIDNYKNIFDKNISGKVEKSLIIAGVKNAISEAPKNYGHSGCGFFFKNSLNCVYECSYCYLRGSFKNNTNVIFVNYDDIKKQILAKIKEVRKKDKDTSIWFYSSDYSDNLAIDNLTDFTREFIPFFEGLENVFMEIRTKSVNTSSLLKLKNIKNTEIAFSLNPEEIISKYEFKTSSLETRIEAINKLIDNGFNVGVRFIPLIKTNNYKKIYEDFVKHITKEIDFDKIYSVFVGGLLYTKSDYNKIYEKDPKLDILHRLEDSGDGYYRESRIVRDYFYGLFDKFVKEKDCNRCLDE